MLVVASDGSGLPDLHSLLLQLGERRFSNILLEAGPKLLGTFFDQRLVNEVHAFVAPSLAGGRDAPSPIAGLGVDTMADVLRLGDPEIQSMGGDVYVHGTVAEAR